MVEAVLLKPEEVAEALRVSRTRVYEMMSSGALRSVALGRSRRVSAQAVRDLVAQLETEQAPHRQRGEVL